MKNNKIKIIIASIVLISSTSFACKIADTSIPKSKDTAMYPLPPIGMSRHIIPLKPSEKEDEKRVGLRFTKSIKTDCNTGSWHGELSEKVLTGWGYKTYTLKSSPTMSTMMFCNDPPITKDVSFDSKGLLRYNSKLPLVIYTDSNVTVEAVIWVKEARS